VAGGIGGDGTDRLAEAAVAAEAEAEAAASGAGVGAGAAGAAPPPDDDDEAEAMLPARRFEERNEAAAAEDWPPEPLPRCSRLDLRLLGGSSWLSRLRAA